MNSKLELQLNDDDLNIEEVDVADLRSGISSISLSSSLVDSSSSPTPEKQHLFVEDIFSPLDLSSKYPSRSVNASPAVPQMPGPLLATRRPHIVRSQSMPRSASLENKSRRRNSLVDGLSVDPDVISKLRRWMDAFAIVDFDLDVGPIVNGVYPRLFLFPSESENIAFSAFPDSPQFEQGSTNHSFRIRQESQGVPPDRRPLSKDGFLYCFSHFIQRRSADSKRGYTQRALVILTHLQYPALFQTLSSILGPLFEEHGAPMLESACHNIATWSDSVPGTTLELGFLGTVLSVEIPLTDDTQQLELSVVKDPFTHVLASSAPILPPSLLLFEASISHIWSIWECLVLCEPILIFGSSPSETSQAVWWFRDILKPIPLAGDIRPYFTIHDQEHAQLVNKLPPKGGLILGVTNPYFARSCTHWPHVLSIGRKGIPQPSPISPTTAGPVPGWRTKTHNRFISKDKTLLKTLEDACTGSFQQKLEASLEMRQHFCSRTNQMLLPLSRYLNTLIPKPAEMTRTRGKGVPLQLKPFNQDQFFASLKAHGSTLPFRSASKRKEFYERWLKTPSFGLWLAQQEQIVKAVLKDKSGL